MLIHLLENTVDIDGRWHITYQKKSVDHVFREVEKKLILEVVRNGP